MTAAEELRRLNVEIGEREQARDVGRLEQLMHERLELRRADGTMVDRAAYLDAVTTRTYSSLVSEVVGVDVGGDSAAVTVVVTAAGTGGDGMLVVATGCCSGVARAATSTSDPGAMHPATVAMTRNTKHRGERLEHFGLPTDTDPTPPRTTNRAPQDHVADGGRGHRDPPRSTLALEPRATSHASR